MPLADDLQVEYLKDIGTDAGTVMLGCANCLDRPQCGGLHLTVGSLATCLSHCRCNDQERLTCDVVCPRKPKDLVGRIQEVVSFDLNNIPSTPDIAMPDLPPYVPLLHGRSAATKSANHDYLALPLSYALTGRGKNTRARTAKELHQRAGMRPRLGWVLSGTEFDRFVERFWGLPNPVQIFEGMRDAGVVFASSPNFSLTNEVPRQDNMHAMKRIAWVWHFMHLAGLPTALHINGRTDRDFERWADFVRRRPSVKAVAFEFLTGAQMKDDQERYLERLQRFARSVDRRLALVFRGSSSVKEQLDPYFANVTHIDASAYQRTVHRRRAVRDQDGKLHFEPVSTVSTHQMAALFAHNNQVMRTTVDPRPASEAAGQQSLDFWARDRQVDSPPQAYANDETGQTHLFPDEPISA